MVFKMVVLGAGWCWLITVGGSFGGDLFNDLFVNAAVILGDVGGRRTGQGWGRCLRYVGAVND